MYAKISERMRRFVSTAYQRSFNPFISYFITTKYTLKGQSRMDNPK